MSKATPISTRGLFGLRAAFRAGQLTAVLDATSFPNLLAALGASGLPFESLFDGEDAIMLSGEAPYIVALDPARPQAVRDLLAKASYRHAGFVVQSNASLDDLRRHFSAQLHVILNTGHDMALFRFYDTRILLAFLGTLGAGEAAAFWGPVDRAYVALETGVAQVNMPVLTSGPDLPAGATPPVLRQINDTQLEQFSMVTDTVFRARLAAYLRANWGADLGQRNDAGVADLIGDAISDCTRLEVCREMDVVIMSIARMRVPELVGSDEFWRILLEQRPNPNSRAGTFLSAMMLDMEPEQKNAFYQQVNSWWTFEAQEAAE